MPVPCPSAPSTRSVEPPPWHKAWLPVSGGHRLHITQHGRPDAPPVLLLHGGPGSGLSPLLRRFFDPAHWRLIGVDQRGAGLSQPAGETRHNTTADLLADLRALRTHLGVDRWLVVGGSWGATLAVAHAADQPDAVAGLLLRAAFLARPQDIAAFFQPDTAPGPAAHAAWQVLAACVPESPRDDLLPALADRLLADDPAGAPARQALACAWRAWEQALSGQPPPAGDAAPAGEALAALLQRYRVQAHYLRHGCWLQAPSLLARAAACPPVPTLLLHGTADRICPPEGAQALHAALPHSRLQWVPQAGHDPTHPAMAAAMAGALANFAAHGDFDARAPAADRPTPCPCA